MNLTKTNCFYFNFVPTLMYMYNVYTCIFICVSALNLIHVHVHVYMCILIGVSALCVHVTTCTCQVQHQALLLYSFCE